MDARLWWGHREVAGGRARLWRACPYLWRSTSRIIEITVATAPVL